MFSIITCAVISITAVSITKKPMKNYLKKIELNHSNTKLEDHLFLQLALLCLHNKGKLWCDGVCGAARIK